MDGKCYCNDGWGGDNCGKRLQVVSLECPRNCSGRGICRQGVCFCEHGKYFGSDCSQGKNIYIYIYFSLILF